VRADVRKEGRRRMKVKKKKDDFEEKFHSETMEKQSAGLHVCHVIDPYDGPVACNLLQVQVWNSILHATNTLSGVSMQSTLLSKKCMAKDSG
jgi:hypothetical protein